jgi:hypothetical protein
MNKIKEMYIIYAHHTFHYEDVELPFLNRIYLLASTNNIGIIDKIWFYYYKSCLSYTCCNMLQGIFYINIKFNKLLYF